MILVGPVQNPSIDAMLLTVSSAFRDLANNQIKKLIANNCHHEVWTCAVPRLEIELWAGENSERVVLEVLLCNAKLKCYCLLPASNPDDYRKLIS